MTARIYTRGGDRGETEHPAGGRVRKAHPDIRFLGHVDELGAYLGLARSFARDLPETSRADVDGILREAQTTLLSLPDVMFRGAATEPLITAVRSVESAIDEMSATLPPLSRFLLQSGHPAAAALHVARTSCRRAERELAERASLFLADTVSADRDIASAPAVLMYLNRLSDLLFVAARHVNHATGRSDETV
jgi:cob(I)alamin adenosyltransferase